MIGDPLLREIAKADKNIRDLLDAIPSDKTEYLSVDKIAEKLRDEYIRQGVVSKKSTFDATHVALATVNRADAIVSWNFKHIVKLSKIKGFNRINLENGFREIVIVTPKEVTFDEK